MGAWQATMPQKKRQKIIAIEPIRVFWHNQGWWSLDNRRLFAFRQAGVVSIPVTVIKPKSPKLIGDGSTITVRYGGRTEQYG